MYKISNKYWYTSKILIFLHKKRDIHPSLPKQIGALHRKCFPKDPFFTTLWLFLIIVRCDIFQTITKFQINLLRKYFYSSRFTSLVHSEKKSLISMVVIFKKNTIFLLVLTVGELCNSLNKYQLLTKSGNYWYFSIIGVTSVLYFK